MTFHDKLKLAYAELQATGIKKTNYRPPFTLLLQKCGLKLPPPHYTGFWQNTLLLGSFFGMTWGTIMYFAVWQAQSMGPMEALITIICTGGIYGLAMAAYYRYGARKHHLTPWTQLGEPQPSSESVNTPAQE